MWTKLMVRLWAIVHKKAYRRKAIISTALFLSALVIFCEISCIVTHSISFGGLLALVVAITFVFYVLWKIFERKNSNEAE